MSFDNLTGDLFLSRMNKTLVARELLKLKQKAFPHMEDKAFIKLANVHYSTIAQVKQGAESVKGAVPTLPLIEGWVVACGMTLSEFFSHIEAIETGKRKKGEEPRLISLARSLAQRGDPAIVSALQLLMERQLSA